ncbi:MAG TPA: hypothetical protein VF017_18505 [Thermoanaerobaculia bacterium]|nr:hypothetical protein [Thermoanaerobaculia bacterium]
MSLTALMELLQTHRQVPDECIRRLVAWADGRSADESARALRTAIAVGALDETLFRQTLAVLGGTVDPPPEPGPAEDDSLRPLQEEVSRLEARHEGLARDLAEARHWEAEIAGLEAEIAALEEELGQLREDIAARCDRCAAKTVLLEEIGK